MEVSTKEPFQIIYSLFQHEYLGCLFESFVVQKDDKGRLTLRHQNISHRNMKEFSEGLDDADYRLIELIDSIQQDVIIKKFHTKRIDPADFFLKVYNKEKGDKILQETIADYMEQRKSEIMALLLDKLVFEMGRDGEPTARPLEMVKEPASVLFHFRRNEDNTHYFPTIKCRGEKVDFQYKNALILCNEPAWLLVEDKVYHFDKGVDGKKLKPFLNKKFILIPRSVEESYYKKFVKPLIESFDVYAKGFEIKSERYEARPVLTLTDLSGDGTAPTLFDEPNGNGKENGTSVDEAAKIVVDLSFQYGSYLFSASNNTRASVAMEKEGDNYVFYRVARSVKWEEERLAAVSELGLPIKRGRIAMDKYKAFSWLDTHTATLQSLGFEIRQNNKNNKRYFLGKSTMEIEIREDNDWFDIRARVRFGEYEIPFLQLRKYILRKQHEFELPSGEIAVIPEEWFAQYSEVFAFSEEGDGEKLQLKKHHLSLVNELQEGNLADVTIDNKLIKLQDFEKIGDFKLPEAFEGDLRPYQKAGFNWLNFLNEYGFGGCLADDMGLGKTVQTLALLQAQKEAGVVNASLLILPTSLLYNWVMEAEKFTPKLKIYNYTGTYREKDVSLFQGYDLVITSYGIARLDIDMLSEYYYNYVILDESQAIKNPAAHIAHAVRRLKSKNRLVLTGTPIENSTMDLWSQLSFVNPGLLGSERFFRNEFMVPIEKKKDEHKIRKLNSIIKPFILRRNKSQVVKELPPKMEHVRYCQMTEAQKSVYEETKAYYRNKILEEIDAKGVASSQILLLQGLIKLRQLANHPRLTDETYTGDSGKMEDITHMLENAISNGHKILVFSQFVKHLALIKEYLNEAGVAYSYLDGSTRNRQKEVTRFQEQEEIKVFLISLKAGGVGLNLTAADYVFLLDPWWNPAVEAQAVDRAHRIGQKKTVFTYKYITKDTVEEKILALQEKKLSLVTDLITTEESFMKSLSRQDIESLFD